MSSKGSNIPEKDFSVIIPILRESIPSYDEGEALIFCRYSEILNLRECFFDWRAYETCGVSSLDFKNNIVQNLNELSIQECSLYHD